MHAYWILLCMLLNLLSYASLLNKEGTDKSTKSKGGLEGSTPRPVGGWGYYRLVAELLVETPGWCGPGLLIRVAGLFLFLFLTPCDGHTSNVYPCSFCASIDGSHIHRAEGGQAQWCVADPQAPADILQGALDWACGPGRADCSAIQGSRPCFLPNTPVAHASYAFNTYWQNNKHKGASCHFNAAAFITESNPSHDGCQFVFIQ